MKKSRNSLRIVLSTALLSIAGSGLAGELVWHEGYEEYVDRDFEQFTISAQPRAGSDRLVWDLGYEDFVPENMPQFTLSRPFGPIGDYNPGGYSLQYEAVIEESGDGTEGLVRASGASDAL